MKSYKKLIFFQEFDVVCIGKGDEMRKYPVVKGKEEWRKLLKSKFPEEHKAIDTFFELVEAASGSARFAKFKNRKPYRDVKIF